MRRDLQKLLCEQERYGSSRSYKEVRHKKVYKEIANDDNFAAGRESMKARLDEPKSFSENFNPLWGIIRKNVGRQWDDVYSELCEVFDMRNHVNAHILVHLWDFVERDTFWEDDKVWVSSRWNHPQTLEAAGCQYYVHPLSGVLTKNDKYQSWKQHRDARKTEREAEERKTRIVVSKTLELRRKDEDSPWFVCSLMFLARPKGVQEFVSFGFHHHSRKGGYYRTKYPDIIAFDVWKKKTVENYNLWYCNGYRSASKKELKKYGAK